MLSSKPTRSKPSSRTTVPPHWGYENRGRGAVAVGGSHAIPVGRGARPSSSLASGFPSARRRPVRWSGWCWSRSGAARATRGRIRRHRVHRARRLAGHRRSGPPADRQRRPTTSTPPARPPVCPGARPGSPRAMDGPVAAAGGRRSHRPRPARPTRPRPAARSPGTPTGWPAPQAPAGCRSPQDHPRPTPPGDRHGQGWWRGDRDEAHGGSALASRSRRTGAAAGAAASAVGSGASAARAACSKAASSAAQRSTAAWASAALGAPK